MNFAKKKLLRLKKDPVSGDNWIPRQRFDFSLKFMRLEREPEPQVITESPDNAGFQSGDILSRVLS